MWQAFAHSTNFAGLYELSTTVLAYYMMFYVEEIFGDFEDLETGEVHRAGESVEKDDESKDDEDGDNEAKEKQEMEERIEKKKKLKAAFDVQYPFVDQSNCGRVFRVCIVLSGENILNPPTESNKFELWRNQPDSLPMLCKTIDL